MRGREVFGDDHGRSPGSSHRGSVLRVRDECDLPGTSFLDSGDSGDVGIVAIEMNVKLGCDLREFHGEGAAISTTIDNECDAQMILLEQLACYCALIWQVQLASLWFQIYVTNETSGPR